MKIRFLICAVFLTGTPFGKAMEKTKEENFLQFYLQKAKDGTWFHHRNFSKWAKRRAIERHPKCSSSQSQAADKHDKIN